MARRKNTRRFDPRYFMDEKTDVIKEEVEVAEGRFTGGSIDIDPLSDEEQTTSAKAYYELFEFLMDSDLPGDKPSDKLQYALRWIAKFEQGGAAGEVGFPQAEEPEKEYDPADSPFTRPKAARYR